MTVPLADTGKMAFSRMMLIASLMLLFCAPAAMAADETLAGGAVAQQEAADLREGFNRKYQDYLTAGSQALLPFPRLEKAEWKKLLESRPLRKLYSEQDKYYNSKVYSFTLYQADDDGSYYLDAIGGFWGMDELVYGPIPARDLR